MSLLSLSLSLLLACGSKEPTAPVAAVSARATQPAPLPPRPFTLPTASTTTLKNGIPVVLSENHEVPLVYVNVVLRAGSWTDPETRPGLAAATFDLMSEGAGGMDAAALSAAQRRIGASLSTGAGSDGSYVSVSCLNEKLPEALDLLATVLIRPDFAEAEWELLRKKRLQDLAAARNDPRSISARTWSVLSYGGRYLGHLTNEASFQAMTTADMKAWYSTHVAPQHAMVTVGGATTLAEVGPLLDEKLGGWIRAGGELPALPSVDSLPAQAETRIFLVDKPGATQSNLRVGRFVGSRSDDDYWAFELANLAIGGMFTSRINMVLREEKGWTYGARSGSDEGYLPGRWAVSAGVVREATADSVAEILRQLKASVGEAPLTQEELDYGRGYMLGTWPLRFENPGSLLGETIKIWRYGLPADYLSSTPDRLRAVTLEQAQAAWTRHIQPDKLDILIVGDAAVIREPLKALNLPVVELLPDAKPLPR